MFARAAKVKLMAIPYKGSNPLITDLIAGHIKIGFNPIPVSRGAIEAGHIRALAVTTAKRSSRLPDVATLAEQGLPGFDVSLRYGLSAPAGTPRRHRRAAQQGAQRGARRRGRDQAHPPRRRGAGADSRRSNTPPTSTREETRWSAVVKDLGIVGN